MNLIQTSLPSQHAAIRFSRGLPTGLRALRSESKPTPKPMPPKAPPSIKAKPSGHIQQTLTTVMDQLEDLQQFVK